VVTEILYTVKMDWRKNARGKPVRSAKDFQTSKKYVFPGDYTPLHLIGEGVILLLIHSAVG
jgi:hypothetical protein